MTRHVMTIGLAVGLVEVLVGTASHIAGASRSAHEITRILDLTNNLKHWTILATFTPPACAAMNYAI